MQDDIRSQIQAIGQQTDALARYHAKIKIWRELSKSMVEDLQQTGIDTREIHKRWSVITQEVLPHAIKETPKS